MDTARKIMERKGWIAAALGLTMPGMGQIYNGEMLKGISVFVIFIMTYLGGMCLTVLLPDRWQAAFSALTIASVLAIYLAAIIDGYRKASKEGASYRGKTSNRWYTYVAIWMVESVLIMGGVVGYVKGNVVEAYKIVTISMEPKVLRGDRILVDKTAYRRTPPRVGDIVVFVYPDDRSKVFIKQIAGLPGDTVKLADGRAAIVPHGQAFLLGRNAEKSIDSRSFGFVPLRDLDGRASQVYWSSDSQGVRWNRIGMTLSGKGG
ncbi:MAG: signal peptidase I [Deltaproteobacteria bacterium]|nr:signal peptidase I [Deltaproteobacteria bacterium]